MSVQFCSKIIWTLGTSVPMYVQIIVYGENCRHTAGKKEVAEYSFYILS